jgi:hypothetical protein
MICTYGWAVSATAADVTKSSSPKPVAQPGNEGCIGARVRSPRVSRPSSSYFGRGRGAYDHDHGPRAPDSRAVQCRSQASQFDPTRHRRLKQTLRYSTTMRQNLLHLGPKTASVCLATVNEIDPLMGGRFWPAVRQWFLHRHGLARELPGSASSPTKSRVRVVPFPPDGEADFDSEKAQAARFQRRERRTRCART